MLSLYRLSAGKALIAAVALAVLAGCGATMTALGKRELDVQTRMTNTIFLDPVTPEKRTVYVQVRNTSDRPDFDLEQAVKAELAQRGYQVVEDPEQAHYLLQANVLQAGQISETAARANFGGGFGSTVLGGAVGAAAGRALSRDTGAIIAGGLLGAAASTVADSFVKDVTYSITTDLRVSERARDGVVVTERVKQTLDQGDAGTAVIAASETHDWKRYQTRVMSVANQANLEFEEAAPELVAGLTRSIAGMF